MGTFTTIDDLQRFLARIRLELRDYPDVNELIEGEESSDRIIAAALRNVLQRFNTMPPPIGNFSLSNFPDESLLILGTAGWLQRTVANLNDRNRLPYSDGKVAASPHDKGPLVRQSANMYWQEFLQSAKELKRSMNLCGTYVSAASSEYALLDAYLDEHGITISEVEL